MQAFFESRDEALYIGRMTSYTFPLHVHESVELAYVLSGSCTMQIAGKVYDLKPGDFSIIFPLVPHSYDHISEGTEGFAAFLLPNTIEEYAHTFHMCIPDEPVIRAERLPSSVRSLIDVLMATPNEEHSPFRLAYLHLLLAHVLNVTNFHPAGSCSERGLAPRAIRYIYEHACEDISLASAAHDLGISSSHLSHLFSQQFHINFRQFINAIRIDKAIMQMRDPLMTLTQICYGCGYENMRTFRRAFIQQTGMLPSDYMSKTRSSSYQAMLPDSPKG